VLRFWTVISMSLPRVGIKDVTWQGAVIPAGTTFLMVSSCLVSVRGARLHQLTNFRKPERMGGKL
jgi:hypothetical protein